MTKKMTRLAIMVTFLLVHLAYAAPQRTLTSDAEQFRNIFAGILADQYREQDLYKLIYFPTAEILKSPKAGSAAEFFSSFQSRLTGKPDSLDPIDLYRAGLVRSFQPISRESSEEAIHSLQGGPGDLMTIVIVPGVFGEFIKTHAFEEVFREPSRYRDEFVAKALCRATPEVFDEQYSLSNLRSRRVGMAGLLKVGTLHDRRGEELANVVLFDTRLGSLESMGNTDQISEIFTRRLEKFFSIMGTPSKLLFVGYSRGGLLGLNMLSEASHDKAPWLSHVMGLVALGGVTYGSDLADVAFGAKGADNPLAEQVRVVEKLASDLRTLPEGFEDGMKTRWANFQAWKSAILELIHINFPQRSFSEWNPVSLKGQIDDLVQQFKVEKGVNLQSVMALVIQMGFKTFEIQHDSEYNENILRMKRLVADALESVKELTTERRVRWWRTHTIPAGIRYYAIAGVMADAKSQNVDEKALATNLVSYNPSLPDYLSLVKNYTQFASFTGFKINDSQVAIPKVRFWPEAASLLNPAQTPYDGRFLGVLGVHHWGLALEIVTEVKSGAKDPFPRRALLEALAAKAAWDEIGQ